MTEELTQALHALAQRLCRVATGTEQEIHAALAIPIAPPPLGARECLVSSGVLSRASVELRFADALLTRANLDAVFGSSASLPRTGPGAPHNLVYNVRMNGTPACISMFASFNEPPKPTSAVKRILLRIDPG